MKITKVYIQNYRSISEMSIDVAQGLNAFVGENSVGKSNIFSAICMLLGPVYPSLHSIERQDHYKGDFDNKICIRLDFDDGNYLELAEEWQDPRGNIKSGLNLSGNYITNEQRQSYCSAYLGVERNITDYLPSNKWSLIGRILQEINSQFLAETMEDNGETKPKVDVLKLRLQTIRDEILFSVKDADGGSIMHRFIDVLQEESAAQLNKSKEDFKVDLSLYDPWNFYRTLQLLVQESEFGMEFQASSLGMGVQASITIAILKAYSKINLKNSAPLFIDEPELFLHPHAQRNFYRILRELAESGHQIFYTTHSPDFISAGSFNEIFIVRKNSSGTYINNASPSRFLEDWEVRNPTISSSEEEILIRYKNAFEETGNMSQANEAFFAKKIILVEGQSESLALPILFQCESFNHYKEGISIVNCGSKSELDRFYKLYVELGIPCFVLFDGDKSNESKANLKEIEKESNRKINRDLMELLGDSKPSDYPDGQLHENYIGFEECFENALGDERFKGKKSLRLFKLVKEHFADSNNKTPLWLGGLITNVQKLGLKSPDSILLKRPPQPQIRQKLDSTDGFPF